ncbi:hypothetical protein [Lacrimispora sp.]|uniref:hypothetical protein n=1 Tax=Lacrimispora sp. TaxID=2719234 RepID=UPI00345FBAB7
MKILLITPNFFDYPKVICDEIRRMGHEVDWFDDRPSSNSIIKAIIRVKKNVINKLITRYFECIMQIVRKKVYDKVLIISGQSLSFTEKMLLELKEVQPQAEFILYQWDSIQNFSYIEMLQKHFDRCYSFDKYDVIKNDNLKFLPLFYSRRYEEIGKKPAYNYKYDIIFVGTAHPKKYKYINEMIKKLKSIYKKQFIYFFFPSRMVYFYRKIKNPELKRAKYSEFHYAPIKSAELDYLLWQSKCVLDSAQDGQSGLTIRIFETLGAKRKIITTNHDIVNYDFYREENIYVYNGNFDFNSKFFTKPFVELPNDIYIKYSLRSWLEEIIYEKGASPKDFMVC